MTRREARERAFELLFETDFRSDETAERVFEIATEAREIPKDKYIEEVYFGVTAHCAELDAMLEKHAKGWKVSRMSRVSRSVLRLAAYELARRVLWRECEPPSARAEWSTKASQNNKEDNLAAPSTETSGF